jgi:hypothetical protein
VQARALQKVCKWGRRQPTFTANKKTTPAIAADVVELTRGERMMRLQHIVDQVAAAIRLTVGVYAMLGVVDALIRCLYYHRRGHGRGFGQLIDDHNGQLQQGCGNGQVTRKQLILVKQVAHDAGV